MKKRPGLAHFYENYAFGTKAQFTVKDKINYYLPNWPDLMRKRGICFIMNFYLKKFSFD